MKFIRDLIEQKSGEAGAVAAQPAAKPFKASEFYRIMDGGAPVTGASGNLDDDDEADLLGGFDDFDDILADHGDDAEADEEFDFDRDEDDSDEDDWEADDLADSDADEIDEDEDEDDMPAIRAAEPAPAPVIARAEPKRPEPPRPAAAETMLRGVRPDPGMTGAARPAGSIVERIVTQRPQTRPLEAIQPAAPQVRPSAVPPSNVEVPTPSAGRGVGRAGRAKTRLLGFNTGMGAGTDPFAKAEGNQEDAGFTQFPVGWLVVAEGPGRGAAFTLFNGVTQIGRGEGQTVRLDFGDNSISRENHAAIAYDAETNTFFIGHGGKANLVRCNNMPVLATQALSPGDRIRIGETTLRFVPLCGPDFRWNGGQAGGSSNAANG